MALLENEGQRDFREIKETEGHMGQRGHQEKR